MPRIGRRNRYTVCAVWPTSGYRADFPANAKATLTVAELIESLQRTLDQIREMDAACNTRAAKTPEGA